MARFLFLTVMIAGVGFIAYTVLQYLNSLKGTKGQRKRDLKLLREALLPFVDNLVPSSLKELELLSINRVHEDTQSGISKILTGVFTSIYHEPMIAYARKYYGAKRDLSVSIIKTLEQEFIYYSTHDKTEVYVDGLALGIINSEGDLYSMTGIKIGHIEIEGVLRTHPVMIKEREVGEIINPTLADRPNPRAYEFLEEMSSDELVLFKSLTFLALIEESI